MDIIKTIAILEALASGCSPITGEVIDNDSVLNERNVIRALQFAIDHLKKECSHLEPEGVQPQVKVEIAEADIQQAIQLFVKHGRNPGSSNLTGFFLGTRKFQKQVIVTNPLYGKFQQVYTKGQLIDFFTQYLSQIDIANTDNINNNTRDWFRNEPYRGIDFFQKEKFNKLTESAINQLKEKVIELGIVKTENLTEHILAARKTHPRAYEHWSEKEVELLRKAINYTNDLDVLSACFQRGKGSIESCGQKLIYDSLNKVEKS